MQYFQPKVDISYISNFQRMSWNKWFPWELMDLFIPLIIQINSNKIKPLSWIFEILRILNLESLEIRSMLVVVEVDKALFGKLAIVALVLTLARTIQM